MSLLDASGRRRAIHKTGPLAAGDHFDGGVLLDSAGRELVNAGSGPLLAGEHFDGGVLRDAQGRRCVAVGTGAHGLQANGGQLRDAQGRDLVFSGSGALSGETVDGGDLQDPFGRQSLFVEGLAVQVRSEFFGAGSGVVPGNLITHPTFTGLYVCTDVFRGRPNSSNVAALFMDSQANDILNGYTEAEIHNRGGVSGGNVGLIARCHPTTATYLYARWDTGSSTWQIGTVVAGGTFTVVGSTNSVGAPASGAFKVMQLWYQDNLVWMTLDGVTVIPPTAQSAVLAAGRAGLRGQCASPTNSVSWQHDNWRAFAI